MQFPRGTGAPLLELMQFPRGTGAPLLEHMQLPRGTGAHLPWIRCTTPWDHLHVPSSPVEHVHILVEHAQEHVHVPAEHVR